MDKLVVVDVGSNSVRMSIYQINRYGYYQEIKRMKSDSRLSENMGSGKILKPAAINRTIQALHSFKNVYKRMKNITVLSIATAAVRQARNQKIFLNKVEKQLGLKIRVLSGNEEAYYDYLGVINRVKMNDYLLVDIGGASIELVRVRSKKRKNLISLPIGAVNISERFHLNEMPSAADLFSAQRFLKRVFHQVPWLQKASHYQLVVLGGAARTLARVNRYRQHFGYNDNLNGYHLNQHQIFTTYENLLSRDYHSRQSVPGIEKDKADIIVGGLLPLITLIDELDSRRIVFSDGGVREGLINEYVNKYYKHN
ncbi:Ppx/GppA family phosphatase [Apilactobacillus ozensis]|nr:Ppx/GppA family phosphatase [Apilactobacillus ozensis]